MKQENTSPLTPADCDLREFPFMPLDVVRLRDSDIAAISSGDEFRCAVLLWCASWHQVPAASLPDDDIILAQLAGYGRVVKEWKKVRDGSLRGWVKCSDGRLYHPVVAEKANEAWGRKLERSWATECARIKKLNQRHGTSIPSPTLEDFLSPNYAPPKAPNVPDLSLGTSGKCPEGQTLNVPELSLGKHGRQGEGEDSGQGQYLNPTVAERAGSSTAETRAPDLPGDTPPAAQVCIGLKAMGYSDTNPHDFELAALLNAGLAPNEILAVGQEFQGQGKRFRYVLKTAEGRRRDAANVQPLPPATKPRRTIHDERADTIAALTGRNRTDERPATEPRDITGEATRIA